MAIGSSIIIYFLDKDKQPIILVGKESKYVTDLVKGAVLEDVKRKQLFEGNLTDAKQYFSETARNLEKTLQLGRIQFDTPIEISANKYKVNYRFLDSSSKRGIIKGGIDAAKNEITIDAIVREVAEEIGVNIPKEKLHDLGLCDKYQAYCLDIKEDKFKFFHDRIKERMASRSGEVFDLSFKPLVSMVLPSLHEYNSRSKCAIEVFIDKLHAGELSPSLPEKATATKGGKLRKRKTHRKNGKRSKRHRKNGKRNKTHRK
jgi:hypothetical protein